MQTVDIKLNTSSYQIFINEGILQELPFYIAKVYSLKKIYIITDSNVADIYLKKVMDILKDYEVAYCIIEPSEKSKCMSVYQYVIETLIEKQIRRNDLIIALGGGVVGDIAGFVAGTLYRGMPFINIPTSLLSQVDSSIGGKTGIDFMNHKNIIGCFKQPLMVIVDPLVLKTLTKEDYSSGMGELIKHGVIGSASLLDMLEKGKQVDSEMIYESLLVKKKFVEADEFDQGLRMTLNFGHTFGHIIEMQEHFAHGIAVGLGMLVAIKLGIKLGYTKESCYARLVDIFAKYSLPTTYYDYKDLLSEVQYDKKNLSGTLNFILIKDFCEPFIYKIDENKIKECL